MGGGRVCVGGGIPEAGGDTIDGEEEARGYTMKTMTRATTNETTQAARRTPQAHGSTFLVRFGIHSNL